MRDDLTPLERFEGRYVRPKDGPTLIVGSRIYGEREDRRRRFAHAVGIDMLEGPGVDRVLDMEEPLPADFGRFAHVECCSVLEHSKRPWLLAANVEEALERGGTLYLSAPWVWRVHEYPGDYYRFSDQAVRALFPRIRWEKLCYASDRLRPDHYVKAREIDGHPFLPRTEVVGFGVRR